MLDMAALIAEENRSAPMGASGGPAKGAGVAEDEGVSRLPEAQRGTEPDSPATRSITFPSWDTGGGCGCPCCGGTAAGWKASAAARLASPMAAPSA